MKHKAPVIRMSFFLVIIIGALLFSVFYRFDAVVGEFRITTAQDTTQKTTQQQQPAQQQQSQKTIIQPRTETQPMRTTIFFYGTNLVATKSDTIQYYHQDVLGSNRFTTSSNGRVTSENTQYPYGSQFSKKGATTEYTFTGKEQDDALYYYGARYYDPQSARFISVDPVQNSAVAPYTYANNNPLKFIDPSGARTMVNGIDLTYLDRKWYNIMIPEAMSWDIDPYFYVAITIQELGGVRESGHYQRRYEGEPDSLTTRITTGYQNPGILGVQWGYGAGAVTLGDAVFYANIFTHEWSDSTNTWNYKLTPAAKALGWSYLEEHTVQELSEWIPNSGTQKITQEEAYDPKEPLNMRSFALLRGHYLYNVMKFLGKGNDAAAYQRLNPGEKGYAGEKGYGERFENLVRELQENPDFQWVRDIIENAENNQNSLDSSSTGNDDHRDTD